MQFNLFILFFCLIVSCGRPNQPELTLSEKGLFDSLSKSLNCRIVREYDYDLLGVLKTEGDRGGYFLSLHFECKDLFLLNQNANKAKMLADSILRPLFWAIRNVENVDIISIGYTCEPSLENANQYKNMVYDYNFDSLTTQKSNK